MSDDKNAKIDEVDNRKRTLSLEEGWTKGVEEVLDGVMNSCEKYGWLNMTKARGHERVYNWLMYLSIVLGPVTGILAIVDRKESVNILVTIFAFMNGLISAIVKFSEHSSRAVTHKSVGSKYVSLEGNIRRQLVLDKSQRIPASKYLEWVTASYDEIYAITPLIPDSLYEKWDSLENRKVQAVENVDKEQEKHPRVISPRSTQTDLNPIGITGTNPDTSPPNEDPNNHIKITIGTVHREKREKQGKPKDLSLVDLNMFSDGKMTYELSRLNNLYIK